MLSTIENLLLGGKQNILNTELSQEIPTELLNVIPRFQQ
jgi:hypothetical protein